MLEFEQIFDKAVNEVQTLLERFMTEYKGSSYLKSAEDGLNHFNKFWEERKKSYEKWDINIATLEIEALRFYVKSNLVPLFKSTWLNWAGAEAELSKKLEDTAEGWPTKEKIYEGIVTEERDALKKEKESNANKLKLQGDKIENQRKEIGVLTGKLNVLKGQYDALNRENCELSLKVKELSLKNDELGTLNGKLIDRHSLTAMGRTFTPLAETQTRFPPQPNPPRIEKHAGMQPSPTSNRPIHQPKPR